MRTAFQDSGPCEVIDTIQNSRLPDKIKQELREDVMEDGELEEGKKVWFMIRRTSVPGVLSFFRKSPSHSMPNIGWSNGMWRWKTSGRPLMTSLNGTGTRRSRGDSLGKSGRNWKISHGDKVSNSNLTSPSYLPRPGQIRLKLSPYTGRGFQIFPRRIDAATQHGK